jgi:hypothetical protein
LSKRRGVVALAVVAAAAEVVLSARGSAQAWEPSEAQVASATALVRSIAAHSSADGHAASLSAEGWPDDVDEVRFEATTRDRALTDMGTPGAVVGDRRPVLLFELRGRFVLPMLAPAGYPQTAKGSYLQIIVDPATGQPLDSGVVHRAMALTGSTNEVFRR